MENTVNPDWLDNFTEGIKDVRSGWATSTNNRNARFVGYREGVAAATENPNLDPTDEDAVLAAFQEMI